MSDRKPTTRGTSSTTTGPPGSADCLTLEDGCTTALRGVVADPAELDGLLVKVRDLGVALISVQVIDRPG